MVNCWVVPICTIYVLAIICLYWLYGHYHICSNCGETKTLTLYPIYNVIEKYHDITE